MNLNSLGYLNALGYSDPPSLPDTRTNAKRAVILLARSAETGPYDESERQIAALQGIGYALLALAEQVPEPAPATTRPPRSWFHTALTARRHP